MEGNEKQEGKIKKESKSWINGQKGGEREKKDRGRERQTGTENVCVGGEKGGRKDMSKGREKREASNKEKYISQEKRDMKKGEWINKMI